MKKGRYKQKGVVILLMVFVISVTVAIILLLGASLQTSSKEIHLEYVQRAQAVNVAEAGISEAISWFKNRETQPVLEFSPRRDLSADPVINETDDPTIGIVREFALETGEKKYGRYEVLKTLTKDISQERGLPIVGTVWYIVSLGIVYQKNNGTKKYYEPPNKVLDSVVMDTEIRRLSMYMPADAAILSANRGDWVLLNNRLRIIGPNQGYAVTYLQGTGNPTNARADITGFVENFKGFDKAIYNLSPDNVFGVDVSTLSAMADIYVEDIKDLPNPLPEMQLVFINGTATFNSAHPLVGSGILFVNGQLHISGTGSDWRGLIYTMEDFHVEAVATFYGSIIAGYGLGSTMGNKIRAQGTEGDFTEIYFDPDILAQVRQLLGQYRVVRSPHILKNEVWYTVSSK